MNKKNQSPLKKDIAHHYVEAKNQRFQDSMEVANEFFADDYARPLEAGDILVDQLTEKIIDES